MWHVWLMRQDQKVSQTNNFRRLNDWLGKAQRQTQSTPVHTAFLQKLLFIHKLSAYFASALLCCSCWCWCWCCCCCFVFVRGNGSSENFIDFVAALQCPRLRPRFDVCVCANVCTYAYVCACECP